MGWVLFETLPGLVSYIPVSIPPPNKGDKQTILWDPGQKTDCNAYNTRRGPRASREGV